MYADIVDAIHVSQPVIKVAMCNEPCVRDRVCVYACVCVCLRVCMCACVCIGVSACSWECVCRYRRIYIYVHI